MPRTGPIALGPSLAILIGGLLFVSLTLPVTEHVFGVSEAEAPRLVRMTDPLFAFNAEANVPTWVSSTLLTLCALTLARIAQQAYEITHPWRRHWAVLAALLLYLSLDETAGLHERMGAVTRLVIDPGMFYGWVFMGALLVAVVGLAYLGFLRALPPATRWRFVLAGCLYVGGALGLEVVGNLLGEGHSAAYSQSLVRVLATHLEETLEFTGISVLLCASVRHLKTGDGLAAERSAP